MRGTQGRTFTYDFGGPVPAVWRAMADTARYNAAAALPKQTVTEVTGPDGEIRFMAQARAGGMTLEWEDLPCNWVREHWFEHRRRFTRGPLALLDARLELVPNESGCRGNYRLEATPNGPIGLAILAGGFLRSAEKMFMGLAEQADRFARGQRAVPFVPPKVPVTGAARARLDNLGQKLAAGAYGHGLAERLVDLVGEGLEVDVERIRPVPLARRWNAPDRHVIEACLEATRLGMLELRWDLLCPRCRGAKASAGTLDQIPEGAHCGTCNISYARNFSRNVELVFRPAPAIRPIEGGEFCLLGPMSTPHIWVHVTVEPGEQRDIEVQLRPSAYRLRTLEIGPEADIEYEGGPFPAVVVTDGWVMAGPPSPPGTITLRNRSARRRTFVVEERRWIQDALTADRIATLQAFRDLFSAQVLRPGDEVAIGRVTLLFSDLKGSTAMYEAVGDAAAYRLVRSHFAYLAAIIREHDGAIVKTIGDAVMAAFHEPLQGLRAAIAMQERVADFNTTNPEPIVLKLGLHEGPCIAVTLNDRLDYFGQAVNMAARLQGESEGGDIVISGALAEADGAAGLLTRHHPTQESAPLRGFAAPVSFWRLRINSTPAHSAVA
jgi:class 3 adenylate cyclase